MIETCNKGASREVQKDKFLQMTTVKSFKKQAEIERGHLWKSWEINTNLSPHIARKPTALPSAPCHKRFISPVSPFH